MGHNLISFPLIIVSYPRMVHLLSLLLHRAHLVSADYQQNCLVGGTLQFAPGTHLLLNETVLKPGQYVPKIHFPLQCSPIASHHVSSFPNPLLLVLSCFLSLALSGWTTMEFGIFRL